MDAIEAIEGRRVVGTSRSNTEYEGWDDDRVEAKDHPKSLLHLVRGGAAEIEDWGGYEFDGIRSEVDFRKAMALEEERLRGTWTQRTARALQGIRENLLNLRALRFLR